MESKNIFSEVLYTYDEITSAMTDTAAKLNEYYKDKEDVLIVPVLDGSIVFAGLLLPMLEFDLKVRGTKISSYYDNTSTSGDPIIESAVDLSLVEGRTILLLEDLIDSGLTLKIFTDYLYKHGAKDVKSCVLFSKPEEPRIVEYDVDFPILNIPNEWVAGFGVDSKGKFRNLRDFGIVAKEHQ